MYPRRRRGQELISNKVSRPRLAVASRGWNENGIYNADIYSI